jgi:hypothetical protein
LSDQFLYVVCFPSGSTLIGAQRDPMIDRNRRMAQQADQRKDNKGANPHEIAS